MTDEAVLVYLEADDEITSVVRRVRAADAERVIVVAPGRSRATSSAVALRLLARVAGDEGRQVIVVGDALTRSLAAEAELPAYISVDDARAAKAPSDATDEPRHAAINVVRGTAEETVTVAVPLPPSERPTAALDETLAVPVTPAPAVRERPAGKRRPLGLAVILGIAAVLIAAGATAAAIFLPAATVTITPRTLPVEATYELEVAEPTRRTGTVRATATVTATEPYEDRQPAGGVVTFRNFNTTDVEVPAGTLVAAGIQAFETTEAVVVPSGSLTSDGSGILAGESEAGVVASAAGPAANVAAEAINEVLSDATAAQLRGFPQNNARLVINVESTTGGTDESGVEISQADVDAALTDLDAELRRLAGEARPEVDDLLVVEAPAGEPMIDLPDALVGMRDEPEVEISGTLAWEVVTVDPEPLRGEVAGRLAERSQLPDGFVLLPDTSDVTFDDPVRRGDDIVVTATAAGRAAPELNEATIRTTIAGLSQEEAEEALADLGDADVVLWPGWVALVPELDWRVSIRIQEAAP